MQNTRKKTELTLEQAIAPIIECQLSFSDQRMLVNEMFAATVANAPDNETENFTANRLKNFYLALSQTLENISNISECSATNTLFIMDRILPEFRKF
jgi:hypothetical protein